MSLRALYPVGAIVRDEDGNEGVLMIVWNDGDMCVLENDAAHPNPRVVGQRTLDGDAYWEKPLDLPDRA